MCKCFLTYRLISIQIGKMGFSFLLFVTLLLYIGSEVVQQFERRKKTKKPFHIKNLQVFSVCQRNKSFTLLESLRVY